MPYDRQIPDATEHDAASGNTAEIRPAKWRKFLQPIVVGLAFR